MLSEPNISYKPFWGICRPLNSWRANSPNPIQIYCAIIIRNDLLILGNMLVDDYILDILLVLWRHMLLDRTVLVKPSVQPGMGTDSVSTVENLYRGFGESDIYLLLDVCHSREENTRWHERK